MIQENLRSRFGARLPNGAAAFVGSCEGTHDDYEEARTVVGGAVGFAEGWGFSLKQLSKDVLYELHGWVFDIAANLRLRPITL